MRLVNPEKKNYKKYNNSVKYAKKLRIKEQNNFPSSIW